MSPIRSGSSGAETGSTEGDRPARCSGALSSPCAGRGVLLRPRGADGGEHRSLRALALAFVEVVTVRAPESQAVSELQRFDSHGRSRQKELICLADPVGVQPALRTVSMPSPKRSRQPSARRRSHRPKAHEAPAAEVPRAGHLQGPPRPRVYDRCAARTAPRGWRRSQTLPAASRRLVGAAGRSLRRRAVGRKLGPGRS